MPIAPHPPRTDYDHPGNGETLADGPEAVAQTFMRSCDAGNTLDDFEALVCRPAIAQAGGNPGGGSAVHRLDAGTVGVWLEIARQCASRPATASGMQLIVEG